ncbi:hypothetical protein D5E87_17625 [Vibrio parahaemolyticus]|nr:hypothetical protein D5E87_17625 [Vibrio parahaemolyticus]
MDFCFFGGQIFYSRCFGHGITLVLTSCTISLVTTVLEGWCVHHIKAQSESTIMGLEFMMIGLYVIMMIISGIIYRCFYRLHEGFSLTQMDLLKVFQ